MPAADPRPTKGASANASDPATNAVSHSHAANPNAAWTGISSPGSVPKVPAAAVATNTNTIASVSITTWPATFSIAIRRRVTGEAARISMLPRRNSMASVADRARIDHSAVTRGKNPPYLYWM